MSKSTYVVLYDMMLKLGYVVSVSIRYPQKLSEYSFLARISSLSTDVNRRTPVVGCAALHALYSHCNFATKSSFYFLPVKSTGFGQCEHEI